VLSYLLVYFLNPLACSFYINRILLNQVQMDQILFLVSISNNALKLFIFFGFFFQLTLISRQWTLAHSSFFPMFFSFLHLGQL